MDQPDDKSDDKSSSSAVSDITSWSFDISNTCISISDDYLYEYEFHNAAHQKILDAIMNDKGNT